MYALLNPGSVVLIGASRREGTIGRTLLTAMQGSGFTGALHVVHPEADNVLGIPAHRRLADVPRPVDLAVVAVPASAVLDVVHECTEAGVRGLVVVSGGFAEAGEEGLARQRELVRLARADGMRVVGPNSWGILNADPAVRLNISLRGSAPPSGRFGVFCQSGALSVAVLDFAERRSVGVSTFLSAGNRADVSANDCLQYWEADERTDAVCLYLESTGNPRKFSRIARRVSRAKPVLVLTSGTSGFGIPPGQVQRGTSQAPAEAFDAMLQQAGCIRVRTLHELFDVAQLVLDQPLPEGNRVAVVANSVALAAMVADACVALDLTVVHGPVAVPELAGPEEFRHALQTAFAAADVDSVVAVFAPAVLAHTNDVARVLAETAAEARQPVVGCLIGWDRPDLVAELNGARRVPTYETPEEAVLALADVTRYAAWRRRPHGAPLDPSSCDPAAAEKMVEAILEEHPEGIELDPRRAAELLAHYGIEVWPSLAVSTPADAQEAADRLGWPVALKTTAPYLRHRVDLGGVRLDIADAKELARDVVEMTAQMSPLGGADLVLQKMAPVGVACVVRTVEDAQYGPVVSFGLGGDASELLGDLAHRVAPLTDVDVRDMIRSVRAAPKLFGHRGAHPVDVDALEDLLARVSCLTDDLPDVSSVDLNPVVVSERGVAVLAATVRLDTLARLDDRRKLSASP
jgi:acyl-CoA synthetase (NDP forming)